MQKAKKSLNLYDIQAKKMISRLPDIMHGIMLALFINYAVALIVSKKKPGSAADRARILGIVLMLIQTIKTIIWIADSAGSEQHVIMTPVAAMLNLFAVPFVAFILLEISHRQKVRLNYILENTSPFLALFAAYVLTKGRTIDILPDAIYYSFLIMMLAYICYFIATFVKVIREHDRKVSEFYADTEGKTLGWFKHMLIAMILLAALYFSLYILGGSLVTILLYYMLSCIIWSLFAWHILNIEETDDMDESLSEDSSNDGSDAEPMNSLDEFMKRVHDVCMDKELYTLESLKRDDVARALLTNHTTLTARIKKATGLTFSEYIGSLRLEAAAGMLLKDDETIERIAYSCGYRDKSTFYRAFTKTYGCSPKEYRLRKGK